MYFNINQLKRSMLMSTSSLKNKGISLSVTFCHAYRKLAFPEKLLRTRAREIHAGEKIPKRTCLNVILCSDHAIKRLNTLFRGKPCPTDVLSFNYDENDLLGEIYISLQRAKIQARRFGVSYNSEVERLFIHGMFHLLGFDHETAPQRKLMEAMENRYRRL
jgi:probable rRNA maturation factor